MSKFGSGSGGARRRVPPGIAQTSAALACSGWAMLGVACSNDSSGALASELETATPPGEPGQSAPGGSQGAAPGSPVAASSRYVFGTVVTGPEGDSSYVSLLPSLDLAGAVVSLDQAREFPGSSDLWVRGGKVYIASGDQPSITRYSVDRAGRLVEEQTLSFAGQGLQSAAFWNNTFISDEKAYMANGVSELVVWNPTTMEIAGTLSLPPLPDRGGLVARPGLADRANIIRAGKLYQPIYWTDENYAGRSDDSRIAVIDVEQDQFLEYLSIPCPSLDYGTVDDTGTLYFSNWTGSVGTHLVLGTAQNCVVALDPSSNDSSRVFDFAQITGGHEGAALAYVGAGHFALSVFHEEKVDLAAADDPFAIVADPNWQLYDYEPRSAQAEPIAGIDWNSGAVYYARVGNRVLPMVPGENYNSTNVYALGAGARATPLFATKGWVLRIFELGAGQ